jgi:hypothetical protein
MKDFLAASSNYFYSDILLIACSLLASIVGFMNRFRYRELTFFYLYPFFSFIQSTFVPAISYLTDLSADFLDSLINLSILAFMMFEFFIVSFYYVRVLALRRFKISVIALATIYLIFFLTDRIVANPWYRPSLESYLFQSLFVLTPAVFYSITLIKSPPNESLTNSPTFWITVGTLIYFLGTLPIYIVTNFVLNDHGNIVESSLFSINYFCYSIFFILILRAYLCKPHAKQ